MITAISGRKRHGKDTGGALLQYIAMCKYNATGLDLKPPADYVKQVEENMSIYRNFPLAKIIKFADPLYEIAQLFFNKTREELESSEWKDAPLPKEWGHRRVDVQMAHVPYSINTLDSTETTVEDYEPMTGREWLQRLGVGLRDTLHKNVWVNIAQHKIGQDISVCQNLIITDVRFANEANMIKSFGGKVIRIHRPSKDELRLRHSLMESNMSPHFIEETCRKYWLEEEAHGEFEHSSESSLDEYQFDHWVVNDGSIEDLHEKLMDLNLIS